MTKNSKMSPAVEAADDWEDAKEVQSNWFKFENIGDKIKGTLMKRGIVHSENPAFADQMVCDLKTDKGVYHVGISVKKAGTIDRLNNCQIGEIIGIRFAEEGAPSAKGFKPAKHLKIVSFGMDSEYKAFDDSAGTAEDSDPAVPNFNDEE